MGFKCTKRVGQSAPGGLKCAKVGRSVTSFAKRAKGSAKARQGGSYLPDRHAFGFHPLYLPCGLLNVKHALVVGWEQLPPINDQVPKLQNVPPPRAPRLGLGQTGPIGEAFKGQNQLSRRFLWLAAWPPRVFFFGKWVHWRLPPATHLQHLPVQGGLHGTARHQ